MHKRICAAAILLSALLPAAAQDNNVWPSEVSLPNTRYIRFTAASMDIPVTLSISIPFTPPPKEGYPVLYVLDGDGYFATAANFSILLQDRAAVVVGIGHGALNDRTVIARYAQRKPGDTSPIGMRDIGPAFNNLRSLTLTPPLAPEHRAPTWFDPSTGGDVDGFLQMIETEAKPRVEALTQINKAKQAIFGHSIGGLAVVRALFTRPQSYQTFIASSPSLWYGANMVLRDEAAFTARVRSAETAPRIFITNGETEDAEGTLPNIAARLTPERLAQWQPYAAQRVQWGEMIPLGRGLAERLSALKGGAGYRVQYRLIGGLNHGAAPFTSIGMGMQFAFSD